jgi:hypothetical protein
LKKQYREWYKKAGKRKENNELRRELHEKKNL